MDIKKVPIPHAPGKVAHRDSPDSEFELLTPEEHRIRHHFLKCKNNPTKSVTFTFLLGGNSVCGQEDKPDSCLECDKLTSCVMEMFHEAVGKDEPDPLDLVRAYCDKRAKEVVGDK